MAEVEGGVRQTIIISGRKVSYLTWGSEKRGHAEPLIFIHDFAAGASVWEELGPRFGQHRETIALDLPGHGQSDRIEDTFDPNAGAAAWSATRAEWVMDVLSTLKIDQVMLCGHGLGGAIALECALTYPSRVATLTMCASGARLAVGMQMITLVKEQFSALSALLESVAFSPVTPPAIVTRWLPELLQAPQEVTLADLEACEALDLRNRVAALDLPTMLLAAKDDLLAPPRLSTYLAGQIRGAKLMVLEDAGHYLIHEKPDAFVQALLGFLERRAAN